MFEFKRNVLELYPHLRSCEPGEKKKQKLHLKILIKLM